SKASVVSFGRSLAQPTINSSAFGSRSLSRKGDGSMASNNCLSSPTCISMIEHFGGMGSPAEALSTLETTFAIALPRIIHIFRYPMQVLGARDKPDYHTLQTHGNDPG